MTKKEIEDIKSLLTGLAGISSFKSTHKRVDKAIAVLDRELSKLHQPTVISSVCNSPCCKEQGIFELPLGSEWYCKEHYKQTDL